MSHYAEYLHGSMSDDEFTHACNKEFAGDDYEYSECDRCPYYHTKRIKRFSRFGCITTTRGECEYDYCVRDEERENEE